MSDMVHLLSNFKFGEFNSNLEILNIVSPKTVIEPSVVTAIATSLCHPGISFLSNLEHELKKTFKTRRQIKVDVVDEDNHRKLYTSDK